MSDGSILCGNNTPVSSCSIGEGTSLNSVLHATTHQKGDEQDMSDSTQEILICENEISCYRLVTSEFIYYSNLHALLLQLVI